MKTVAATIRADREVLAAEAVGRAFDAHPDHWRRYGVDGRKRCIDDTAHHLDFLAEAVEFARTDIFSAYLHWAADVLRHRSVPDSHLVDTLRCLAETMRSRWADARGTLAATYVEAALDAMQRMHVPRRAPLVPLARNYLEALLRGDKRDAIALVLDAVDGGMPVQRMYLDILQPTLHEVGLLWQTHRISVAQEHFCASCTGLVMSLLYPRIANARVPGRSVVLCCVQGEQHEMGLRMVGDLLETGGWGVYCAGASLPAADVLRAITSQRADLLAVSCTYVPNLHRVAALIRQARSASGGHDLKVMVGGLAFSHAEDIWREVGADGFASDAAEALTVANRLVVA